MPQRSNVLTEMQPLSKRTRRTYLYILVVLFFAILPFTIFYASGYRFKSGIGFVQTGGISISVPYDGAVVSLNGEEVGESRFLNRNFYIDDLLPGSYAVLVSSEEHYPWYRTLVVERELVSDARALLLSKDPEIVLLLPQSTSTPELGQVGTSSTRVIDSDTHAEYLLAFDEPAATTTSGALMEQSDMGVYVVEGDVVVRWLSPEKFLPSNFCTAPSQCVFEIPIETGSPASLHAGFFGGGVVYGTAENGIIFSEADVRPTPVSFPLYPKRGAEFRIIDGLLILKDGKELYQVVEL